MKAMENHLERFAESGIEVGLEKVNLGVLLAQERDTLTEGIELREKHKTPAVKDKLLAKARTYLLVTLMAAGVAGEARPAFGQSEQEAVIHNTERSKDISSKKKAAYEHIKQVVEKNHLKKTVEFLQGTFGTEVDRFFSFAHVRDAIELTDETAARVAAGDSSDLEDTGFENNGSILSMFYDQRGWAPKTTQEKEASSKPLTVTGFDTLGIDGNGRYPKTCTASLGYNGYRKEHYLCPKDTPISVVKLSNRF